MATSYTGLRVQDTYNAIIKIGDNSNLSATPKLLSDGVGNDTPLYLSGTRLGIGITPAYQFHTSGNAKIGGNLIISGNLTVNGTLTYLNVEDLAVEDPLIKLAKDNTSNTLDIGFFGKYVESATTKYTGLFWDASTDKFRLYEGLQVEPTTTVDVTGTGYTRSLLNADLEGNVTGTVSSLSNHDTNDLVEGSVNLYFTTARARASFSGGTGVTITNGEIAIGQDVGTTSNVTFGNITGSAISGTTGAFSSNVDVDGNLQVDGTIKDSDGDAGTSGQVLSSTGSGTNWIDLEADVAKRIDVTVKNVSGASLAKGVVVHAAPTATPPSGNVIEVIAADANDATKMPSIGVLNETIADEAEGEAVMFGAVSGIDTSSFSIGDELYVSETAGEFTATKPTAYTSQVQKIAVVIKSHASNGLIKVFGAGRSNDVPNRVDRNVNFTDNSKLTFGDSTTPDLEIYHDASNSYIHDNGTGELRINSGNAVRIRKHDNETMALFTVNGSVDLRYDNVTKFETTSSGIDVTGAGVFSGNVDVDGGQLNVTSSTGLGRIELGGTTGGYIDLKAPASDDYDMRFIVSQGGNEITTASGDLKINTANTLALTIDSTQNATFAGNVSTKSITALFKGTQLGSSGYYINSTFKDDASNVGVFLAHNDTSNGTGAIAGINQLAFLTYGTAWTQALLLDSSQNATFAGNVTANSFIKSGGTSSQYLMADGSVSTSTGVTGTGVNNRLAIWNGTTAIDSDSDFYVDGDTIFTTNLEASGSGTFAGNVDVQGNFTSRGIDDNADAIAITINGNEEVGIGGTPFHKLDVYGTFRASGNATFASDVQAQGLYVGSTNTSFDFYNNGTSYLNGAVTVDDAFTQTGGSSSTFSGQVHIDSKPNSGLAYNVLIDVGSAGDGTIGYQTVDQLAVNIGASTSSNWVKTGNNIYNSNSGNVGIGTTSPVAKFEVTDGSSSITLQEYGNGAAIFLDGVNGDFIGGDYFHILANGNSYLGLGGYGGGATPLNITNAGKVGIGTTSPNSLLHLESASSPSLQLTDTSQTTTLKLYAQDSNTHIANITTHDMVFDTANTERMRIHSNGRVSIGSTTASANTLTLSGTDTEMDMTNTSTNGRQYRFESDSAGNFIIKDRTANVDRIVMNSSGNVGIGTTSPSSKLDVHGEIKATNTGANYMQGVFVAHSSTSDTPSYRGQGYFTYNEGHDVSWFMGTPYTNGDFFCINRQHSTTSFDTAAAYIGNANTDNFFSITNAGNVGIGTTSPQSKLHIETGSGGTYNPNVNHDDVTIEGSGNIGLQLFSPATSYQYIAFGDPDSVNAGYLRYYHGTNQMVFRTNGSDNMVINSSGNVGIGTTSPDYPLEVESSGSNAYVFSENTAAGGASGYRWKTPDSEFSWYSAGGQNNMNLYDYNATAIRMTIDSSGNVGIGTTSPSTKFHVRNGEATIASDTDGVKLSYSNGNSSGIIDTAFSDNNLEFRTNGTAKMWISNAGNVGIGTTSPSAKLDVSGSGALFMTRASAGLATYIENDGGYAALYMYQLGGGQKVKIHTNGTSFFNGGKIGINETAPATLLSLSGVKNTSIITLKSTTNDSSWSDGDKIGGINFYSEDGSGSGAGIKGSISYIAKSSSGGSTGLTFRTSDSSSNDVERMFIDNSGVEVVTRLGIQAINASYNFYNNGTTYLNGTTTIDATLYITNGKIAVGTPMPQHQVDAYSATSGVFAGRFVYAGTSGSDCAVLLRLAGGSTSPSYIDFIYGTSQTGAITTNGSSTIYLTSSDYRLKENVVELNGALDRIDDLKPKRFNFISDIETTVDGFLAHEVAEVVPEAIHGEKDAVNEDGEIIAQGIDQSKLVPLLVAAVQELRAEVKLLKSQINS